MKRITMFLFVAMAVSCSVAQSTVMNNGTELNKKEKEVWEKVVALNSQVFGTKDSVIIAGLVNENVEYGHSGGNIEHKQAMVHNASVSKTVYKDVSHQLISLKIIDKVAVVRYVLKARSIENDIDSPLELGIIQVWQHIGGQWQLLERQAVKLNVKKM